MFRPKGLFNEWLVLIGGDLSLAYIATYVSAWATGWFHADRLDRYTLSQLGLLLGSLTLTTFYFQDLYNLERPVSRPQCTRAILTGEAAVAVSLPFVLFLLPGFSYGRRFYLAYFVITTPSIAAWRFVMNEVFLNRLNRGVAILGNGDEAALLATEIRKREHIGYRFTGFIGNLPIDDEGLFDESVPESETQDSPIGQLIPSSAVTTIVVTRPEDSSLSVRDLMNLKLKGIEVISFESFYERLTGRLPAELLSERWLLLTPGFKSSDISRVAKRITDIVVAGAITLVAGPIALLIAVAVKLDSDGPILYSQERLGQDGNTFRAYKFRSMRADAEKKSGPVWASKDDPRVTRVGRWIRKLRFDELPQLFNVFRGDMSLVGPRPERPEMVRDLTATIPLYDYRHSVRPGITGWAQVCYPYGANREDAVEKLCYDLYYIKNQSQIFDVQIMLQTVKVMLFGMGR